MPIENWSTTPSENALADSASGISWPEDMNPSQINDSARAMMAQIKKWYDDVATSSPWRKVGVYDLAGLSAQDVAIPSGARLVRFDLKYRVSSSGASVSLRASLNGGATFLSGATDYAAAVLGHNGTTVNATADSLASEWAVAYAINSTTVPGMARGMVSVGGATENPRYEVRMSAWDTTNRNRNILQTGHIASSAINALRFFVSTGAFASGILVVEAI